MSCLPTSGLEGVILNSCDIDLFRISADCYEEILHYLILLCEQNSITVCCTEAVLYLVSAVELLLMSMSIQGAS